MKHILRHNAMHENSIRESHIWHDGNNMNLFIVVHWKQIFSIEKMNRENFYHIFMLLMMRITELFNIMHSAAEKMFFYLQSNFLGMKMRRKKLRVIFFWWLKLLSIFYYYEKIIFTLHEKFGVFRVVLVNFAALKLCQGWKL